MNKKADIIFSFIKIVLDTAVVYFSFLAAYWFRFNVEIIPVTKGVPALEAYVKAMPVVILIFLGTFKWAGFYRQQKGHIYMSDEFINIVKAVFAAIVLITAATFIYREYEYSRLVIAYAAAFITVFIFLLHALLRFLRVKIFMPVSSNLRILVVGGEKSSKTFLKNTQKFSNVTAFYKENFELEEIKKTVIGEKIHEVIFADTGIDNSLILELIQFCESKDIEFTMLPDVLELKMGELVYDKYFGLPVLKLKHPLFEPSNYYIKRSFDIILSMLLLMLFGPLLIAVMILIKLDSPGPIVYSHLRKGYKGRDFPFFKFRSMIENADQMLEKLLKFNERSGQAFKMKNDPRITAIGRFIRKYSIDELPQLFNVLRGDMSLVGPRPQVLWETEEYDDTARRRLNILPGITGLWQISGRSDLSFDEMITLDIYYLENWTLGFDLKILLKTVPVVILKKGAC
ncbi:MAG: sugar transferase [Elusimicrobiota bacterium]|nr:sugar transferase [Elusimicrobiota bacterium]